MGYGTPHLFSVPPIYIVSAHSMIWLGLGRAGLEILPGIIYFSDISISQGRNPNNGLLGCYFRWISCIVAQSLPIKVRGSFSFPSGRSLCPIYDY